MTRNQEKIRPRQPVLATGIIKMVNFVGRLLTGLKIPIGWLSEEHLLRTARRKTGLSDFGDDRFRVPFGIFLRSYQDEGRLSLIGRLMIRRRLLLGLINRLLIAHTLKQHPQVLNVQIRRPIFIVSLPRTGTTLLHKLLSQDPHARPLIAWEAVWPTRRPKETDTFADARIRRLRYLVKLFKFLAPQLRVIHDIDPDGPEECVPLLRNTFVFPEIWPPSYQNWYLQQPPGVIQSAYAEYRQQLKLIQFRRPQEGHWLLKAPFHLFGVEALLKLFPDSVIIMIHRDPCKSIASLCSLADFSYSLISDDQDRKKDIGSIMSNWAAEGLRRAEAAREHAPLGRIYDIQYADLVHDPMGTIQRLYSETGYTYTEEFDTHARDWLRKHPKNKYGKHRYSLEKYGLNRQIIDDAFAWYCERYQIGRESAS